MTAVDLGWILGGGDGKGSFVKSEDGQCAVSRLGGGGGIIVTVADCLPSGGGGGSIKYMKMLGCLSWKTDPFQRTLLPVYSVM